MEGFVHVLQAVGVIGIGVFVLGVITFIIPQEPRYLDQREKLYLKYYSIM